MKLFTQLIAAVAILTVSLFGGALASGIYTRWRYSSVPVHETDVFFDIGFVFLLGFVVCLVSICGFLRRYQRR